MKSEHINPFLEASIMVIEQMCRIRPTLGQLQLRDRAEDQVPLQLQIKVIGDMEGEIVYSFPENVALKLVSEMMGGFAITELDEIGHSAISELGNMISGNASAMLYNQGINIDITPPKRLDPAAPTASQKSLAIPLLFDNVGQLNIYVQINQKTAS